MSTNEPQKPSVPTGSPPTTRFCLVRHGTTDWNRENRIQGVTDTPLNEQGQREISQLAVAMKDEGWEVVVPRREGVPAAEYASAGATWLVADPHPTGEGWEARITELISRGP